MELGMSRWHEVLLECPAATPNGALLSEFIPAQDVIIEIDNKSLTHRPDLWGHYAFARELAAIFGRRLRALPVSDLAAFDNLPAYPLSVDDFDGCPCYGCLEFEVLSGQPSPLFMQRRLHALGQRTFNLMVDVTNYVMLELAQPTHAFDAARISAIRVAPMGQPGAFTTLDGQQRRLLPEDLLIWNEKEPVALAGVMGGLNSEVEDSTGKILLESANFKGSRIRRTSVRLDLRTESAQRFEKGQPPVNVKLGIARILQLVTDADAQPKVTSRFTVQGELKQDFRPLVLQPGVLRQMAGAEISDERVTAILQSLGFQARYDADGRLHVGIPPHRSEKDISIPPDVAEEVLRIYGYGKIPPRMPEVGLKPLFVEKSLRMEHKLRRVLAASHGFVEVQNYGWFDDRWLAELAWQPPDALELKNPATQYTRLLRTALLPNLLALVRPNRAHRDAFRLFEMGRVYRAGQDGKSVETTHLAGISFAPAHPLTPEEHFQAVRGALEDLACVAGLTLAFEPAHESRFPWQFRDHWVAIRCNGRSVGGLGLLAGPIRETVGHDGQVVWFELDAQELQGPIYPELKYAAPPIYPGSWQDFSLLWDVAEGFAALEIRLDGFIHPLVLRREFLYYYKGKGLPPGKASYSYRYWLGAWDHTLTSAEIDEFRTCLLAFLELQDIKLR
jgi:phenylalanyl-tRNA synthetase beta chain